MFFSVIVPIYRVEKYLKRCIDSVLAQSFSDYELILVDDGSPDGCPAICDAYAKEDERIRVIHKENGGLVSARKAGILVAQGEYIFHLDSDDAITEHALQKAYEIVMDTHADIVSFSYQIYKNGEISEPIHDYVPEGLYDKKKMETELYPKLLSDENMEHLFYFVWGKAYRRSLIMPHQLLVSDRISLGEDLSCAVPCYLQAETVYMSREPAYLYTIRDDSISTTFRTEQITQVAEVIRCLRESQTEKPNDFEMQIARYSCFMCFAIFAAAAEGGYFESLDELVKRIRETEHRALIPNAQFRNLSTKSRWTIRWMQKEHYKRAFYFLYFCKKIKCIWKRG